MCRYPEVAYTTYHYADRARSSHGHRHAQKIWRSLDGFRVQIFAFGFQFKIWRIQRYAHAKIYTLTYVGIFQKKLSVRTYFSTKIKYVSIRYTWLKCIHSALVGDPQRMWRHFLAKLEMPSTHIKIHLCSHRQSWVRKYCTRLRVISDNAANCKAVSWWHDGSIKAATPADRNVFCCCLRMLK